VHGTAQWGEAAPQIATVSGLCILLRDDAFANLIFALALAHIQYDSCVHDSFLDPDPPLRDVEDSTPP
jgi:hypothetical protein